MKKIKHTKNSVLTLLVSFGILGSLASCTTAPDGSFRNPFWPKAELQVTDVSTKSGTDLVGIKQELKQVSGLPVIVYTYIEPVVKIQNGANLPSVNFTRYVVKYRLSDGTTLPPKEFPLFKSFPVVATAGGAPPQLEIQFKIMSTDVDLRAVVYPGNNAPRVSDGVAEITLYGKDTNGNEVQLDFTVPLAFQSLAFAEQGGEPPEVAPTPSPSPSA